MSPRQTAGKPLPSKMPPPPYGHSTSEASSSSSPSGWASPRLGPVTNVSAVSMAWNIGTGGPGLSKFWFQELLDASARQGAVDSVRALMSTFVVALRTDWNLAVQPVIQNYSLETGKLTNEVTAGSTPALINGTVVATGAYSLGVGARILWRTGVVLNGRKVIGRTFAVPLAAFTTSAGIVIASIQTSVKAATTAYATQAAARPIVWHKVFGDPPAPDKPPPYVAGTAVPIIAGDLLSAPSSLRSRRY